MRTTDEGHQRFLDSAANHRLLTAKEERDLARRAGRGDESARHELIRCNMRLVLSIARGYRHRGDYEDIVQDGVLGLDHATRKFDPELGFRFTTYATLWVRKYILTGLSANAATIRLPPQVAEHRAKARGALAAEPHKTIEQLAKDLDAEPEEIRRALEAAEVVTSLNREVYLDDDYSQSLLDTVADPHADDPSEGHWDATHLRAALLDLPPELGEIVRLRFGFDGQPPLSLGEIAAHVGKSTTTVQAWQREALRRLRELLSSSET